MIINTIAELLLWAKQSYVYFLFSSFGSSKYWGPFKFSSSVCVFVSVPTKLSLGIYYIFNTLKMLNCRRPIFGPLYLFILFIYPRRAVSFAFWAGPAINKQIRAREFHIYEHCIVGYVIILSSKRPSCHFGQILQQHGRREIFREISVWIQCCTLGCRGIVLVD